MAKTKKAATKKPASRTVRKPAARATLKATPKIAKAAAKSAKRAAKGARIVKAPAVAPAAQERRPGRPILHGFHLSIPACKVGLALTMMGVSFDYRHVDLSAGAQKTPTFLGRNRFGQVPVLEHDGHFISQSNVILQYLADTYDKFAGRSAAEEIRIAEWLQWDQDRMPNLAMARAFTRFPQMKPSDAVLEFVVKRATLALDFLDRHLGTSKFIAGPQPTIADIAIFATVATAGEAGIDTTRWPNIRAWGERFLRLPGAGHPYAAMPQQDRIAA